MNQLVPLIKNTSVQAKIGLAAGTVITLVVFVMLFKMATAPSYETLLTGIDPAETSKVTEALDEQGLQYELQNGGTAVAVQPADVARARIAVAETGLSNKSQKGFELFDNQKLGQSDFQQKVNYQRALEGEIANTISQVDGVSGAKVQLVLPDEQLFAEDAKPATAAVLLSGDTSTIEPASIRGMANLVASSVEGLKLEDVRISDGSGALLWPKGDGVDGGEGATSKLAAEQRYNQALQAKLSALIAGTVGADKARVEVSSTLNVDKAEQSKLVYDTENQVELNRATENEELEGRGGAAGGRAGTAANVPGYAGGNGAAGASNYQRETDNTQFGVGKTVTKTQIAPGAVERQSVAVLLDASVPPAVRTQIQAAVRGAAGIDATRGDVLTVSSVPFAKTPAPVKPNPIDGAVGYAKWVALGLATLLFLFFVSRALKRREGEALGEPVWLREITAPQPLAALEADTGLPSATALERSNIRRRAEEIAAKEPQKVAQQLRAWMQDEA